MSVTSVILSTPSALLRESDESQRLGMEGADDPALESLVKEGKRTGHTKAESLDWRTSTNELPSGSRRRRLRREDGLKVGIVVVLSVQGDDSHRLVSLLLLLLLFGPLLLSIDRGGGR
jgi:hypothetical protein